MKTGSRLQIVLALASFLLPSLATAASGAATAPAMPAADYAAVNNRIAAEAKVDKAACGSYGGHAKDVCLEQARGKEKVARAELEYNYSGKSSDAQKLAIAKAESAYSVAKEMCDDRGGDSKQVCLAETGFR